MARGKAPRPRKRPSQSRSRFTTRQSVEAAARVFEERGYAGATTNRIAERAGVSIGSLYQYFPTCSGTSSRPWSTCTRRTRACNTCSWRRRPGRRT
jgi:hypothetical protein